MITLTEARRVAGPAQKRAVAAMSASQCEAFIKNLRAEMASKDTTLRDKIIAAERPGMPVTPEIINAYNLACEAALVLAEDHMKKLATTFIKRLTRPR